VLERPFCQRAPQGGIQASVVTDARAQMIEMIDDARHSVLVACSGEGETERLPYFGIVVRSEASLEMLDRRRLVVQGEVRPTERCV
jgi:hypothetical protein